MDARRPVPVRPAVRRGLCLWRSLGAVALVAALTGCSPCRYVYAYDGGASQRPYYKVRLCPDQKPVVECDSPTRLPTPGCK